MPGIFTKKCDCEKIRRLFDAAIDNELNKKQAKHFARHLRECEFCREAYEDYKEWQRSTRVSSAEAPCALHNAVMSRVREERQATAPRRLSRPKMALIGSLCVIAITASMILLPDIGDPFAAKGEASDNAPTDEALTNQSGTSVGSPETIYGDTSNGKDNTVEDSTDSTGEDEGLVNRQYTVTGRNITIRLADGKAHVINGQTQYSCEYTIHNTLPLPTLELTHGEKTATFVIDGNVLIPKGGDLFD